MSAVGLEPTTNGLKGHCSTIELCAPVRRILSRMQFCVNAFYSSGLIGTNFPLKRTKISLDVSCWNGYHLYGSNQNPRIQEIK